MSRSTKVVIVGAGIAGLTCAYRLRQAGVESLVIEASDRVGGRILGFQVHGRAIQLGGRWTGPGQDRLEALTAELGLRKVDVRSMDDISDSQAGVSPERIAVVRLLDTLAARVPLESPWLAPDAEQLDAQTLHSWLSQHATEDDARSISGTLTGFLPEARDVSLLHTLFYLHSNGGLAAIMGLDDVLHDSEMIDGGAHRLIESLAATVNDQLILSSPVHEIVTHEQGLRVLGGGGEIQAEHAIVAVPPTLAGRLRFSPAMPPDRDYLTQRMPIRGKVCFAVLFDQPFWRIAGRSLYSNENMTAWDEGGDDEPYCLSGLVSIPHSRELGRLDEQQRKLAVIADLTELIGEQIQTLVGYYDVNWAAEPWTRGCNSFLPPGVWTAYGHALRPAVGRVHWAGSEYSPVFVGQMDGAIRCAEAVVAKLTQNT